MTNEFRPFTGADARFFPVPNGKKIEVQCDDREYRQQFTAVMVVGAPQFRDHVNAGTIVRWRPAAEDTFVGIIAFN